MPNLALGLLALAVIIANQAFSYFWYKHTMIERDALIEELRRQGFTTQARIDNLMDRLGATKPFVPRTGVPIDAASLKRQAKLDQELAEATTEEELIDRIEHAPVQ